MKKLTLLLLPMIVLVSLGAFRTEKPVLLRLNLQKGSTYLYKTMYDQNITTKVAGQTIDAKMNMESDMNLHVIQKYKTDSTLIEARYKRLLFHIAARGTETTFDSRDTTGSQSKQLREFTNAMQANPVTIKTNSLGKILEIRGLDKVRSTVSARNNPAMQKMLDNILSDNTFKNSFTNLGIFPEKPVSVGDHWERTLSMDNIIPLNIHTTYTVKDIQPGNVLLDVSAQITSLKDSATINGMTIPAHVAGTQTGTYTIDRHSGLISGGNLVQKMTMTMSMMGQNMDIDINGKYNVAESLVQ